MAKKIIICLFFIVMLLGTVGYTANNPEIKIGWYGPMTGPNSLSGNGSRKAAQLAVDQINKKGGIKGKKIQLITYDDKSSPEEAVKCVSRLIDVDQVHCLIGSMHSGNILASAPLVEKAQIPEVGTGTSPAWLQKGYKYLFRALPNSGWGNIRLAEVIQKMGATKVGFIFSSTDYGKVGSDDLSNRLKDKGIQVMAMESFQPGDTDWTGQITKILSAKVDGVILYTEGEYLALMMKQLRQLGYKGYVYGPEGFTLPQVRQVSGQAADGAIYACAYVIPDSINDAISKIEKQFLLDYMAKYGHMPESDNCYRGYDAVNILAVGLRNSNSLEGPKIRDAIENITHFEGLAGTFNFKGNHGEGINTCRIYVIDKGKNVLFEKWIKTKK